MQFIVDAAIRKPQPADESIRKSFMADDIFGYMDTSDPELLEIDFVYITPEYRRKGIGSLLINEVIELHPDMLICCACGSFLSARARESIDGEDFETVMNTQREFFTSLGFTDINDIVEYEKIIPMIYNGNKIGADIIAKMRQIQEV